MIRLTVGLDAAPKDVWRWQHVPPTLDASATSGALPGNKADEQFVKQASSASDFSCDYTGRFDGGQLPPQRRHPQHVITLDFLSSGREAVMKQIVAMQAEDKKPATAGAAAADRTVVDKAAPGKASKKA